ncbi:hypothetical protein RHJ80_02420 [Thermosynechococcus sp. QS41]|uniref:hypothetical protein n=1 Tax=Thermosynechococcus sp. QS41 TaxID=3074101 RepID=UPI002877F3AD|nr:hypothetical protein [Thermosynechococcus sp. QS41]WNC60826.1 hypothetical protein RHJ80_02420 [Thermosynechococcus sp. QS41]
MTIEPVELPRRVGAKFQASQFGLFCLHFAQFVGDRQHHIPTAPTPNPRQPVLLLGGEGTIAGNHRWIHGQWMKLRDF